MYISRDTLDHIIKKFTNVERSKGNFIKWKFEDSLFLLTKVYYSDAIYQFRSHFSGQQSLDIYIPSVKAGIEY